MLVTFITTHLFQSQFADFEHYRQHGWLYWCSRHAPFHIGFVSEMTCGCFCFSAPCVVRLRIHVHASVPEVSQIDMALSVGSGSRVFVGKSDPFCAPQACTDCSRWQPLKQPCPSDTLLIDVVFLHETGAGAA